MSESEIFNVARKLPLEQREVYLAEACPDEECRRELESLLRAHDESGSFLKEPAIGDMTTDFPSAEKPGTRIGPYRLMEQIGEGGFGLVFVAEQQEPLRRKVALKVIKPGMDTRDVVARFEAERQALALMDHPNIARVLDGGATPTGRPFFVMELVKGVPITEYCDAHQLPPRARLELFLSVCQAVQHAHQKGIIHRDLKPSNILVAPHDGVPVVKVIDFGVAKALGQQLTEKTIYTRFAQMIGTPLYMSPEQAEINALDVDIRSDVYSLGVLLYELLTGTTPVDRERLATAAFDEMRRIIREEEAPRPSTRLSTMGATLPIVSAKRNMEPGRLSALLRGDLDWVVMKALEKDRNRRYESASAFATELRRFLAEEPVEARPPTMFYRLSKFTRRNRGPVVVGVVVLLLLTLGLAGTSIGLILARQEAQRARQAESDALTARDEKDKQRLIAEQLALSESLARKQANEEAVRAAKSRERIWKVLNDRVASMTGNALARQKELTDEQKEFLDEVVNHYLELIVEAGESRESREHAADAAYRVGTIHSMLGKAKESAIAFCQARDVYRQLAKDNPEEPAFQRNIALCCTSVGHVFQELGRWKDAEDALKIALDMHRKLAIERDADVHHRRDLARTHVSLGNLYNHRDRWREAEESYLAALRIRETVAQKFKDDAESIHDVANTLVLLGGLHWELSNFDQAQREFETALEMNRQLVEKNPENHDYRSYLASAQLNLGLVYFDIGRVKEAEESFHSALNHFQVLSDDLPSEADIRYSLGVCHINLGALYSERRRWAEAEGAYRAAIATFKKLAANHPAVLQYRQYLAVGHEGLGDMLCKSGKFKEAEPELRTALELLEPMRADFATMAAYQVDLAGTYHTFGELRFAQEKYADAITWNRKAIDELTPVIERQPKLYDARKILWQAHRDRAKALGKLDQFAKAIPDWNRAIELAPDRKSGALSADRAMAKLRAGDIEQAVTDAGELSKRPGWNAERLYQLACIHAVASTKGSPDREARSHRALELLRHAFNAGFNDLARLEMDADLANVRGRDGFRQLLSELRKTIENKTP